VTYLALDELGIDHFVVHSIRAFCPTPEALRHLGDLCSSSPGLQKAMGKKCWLHELYERPIYIERAANNSVPHWSKPQPGFAPVLSLGKTAASMVVDGSGRRLTTLLRLLRQGVGIVTELKITRKEDDLVEPVPKHTNGESRQRVLRQLLGDFARHLGADANLVFRLEKTNDDSAGQSSMDMIEDTAFELVEIVFNDMKSLRKLSSPTDEDAPVAKLRSAIMYLLTRSYWLDGGTGKSGGLKQMVDELRHEALPSLAEVREDGQISIRNLSQSWRAFVTLGPRGAVLCYAKNRRHPMLRVAALNMIEILRGRHFNMIVARTVADNTIRTLEQVAREGDERGGGFKRVEKALEDMMLANYLYGLVVSDPGVYLLDGSTLTLLAELADKWHNLKELREDTDRKMTALYRLWQHFQDSQRIEILSKLSEVERGDALGRAAITERPVRRPSKAS